MFKKIYMRLVSFASLLQHPFLLIIRCFWGIQLILTGYGKLSNLSKIASYFHDLHIPEPKIVAIIVAIIEVTGGIALVLGLFSRLFSLLLIGVFAGAYMTAHSHSLKQIFSHPGLFTKENPFLFLYTCLVVLCFGAGYFSCDHFLFRKK